MNPPCCHLLIYRLKIYYEKYKYSKSYENFLGSWLKARPINELTIPLHFANQEYYISQGIKRPCWLVLLCVPYGYVCVKRGTYGKAENG